eukprot:9490776-Pyramimonas_sp.AAC.1
MIKKFPSTTAISHTCLTDSMCNIHLLYSTEVWNNFTANDFKMLDSPRISSYRVIQARKHHAGSLRHFFDEEVLVKAMRTPLHTVVRRRRLIYFCTLFVNAPKILFAMVDFVAGLPGSWTSLLQLDLQWLDEYDNQTEPTTLQSAFQHIQSDPHSFRLRIGRAWRRFRAAEIDRLRQAALLRHLQRVLDNSKTATTSTGFI